MLTLNTHTILKDQQNSERELIHYTASLNNKHIKGGEGDPQQIQHVNFNSYSYIIVEVTAFERL